jgi:hypothetical protein
MLALAATLAAVAAGCGGGNGDAGRAPAARDDRAADGRGLGDTLVVYGRAQDRDLFERFERDTGIEVLARSGPFDDLADQIIEYGADSPADVFYGTLSDGLGLLSAAGRLTRLSDEQLDRVPSGLQRRQAVRGRPARLDRGIHGSRLARPHRLGPPRIAPCREASPRCASSRAKTRPRPGSRASRRTSRRSSTAPPRSSTPWPPAGSSTSASRTASSSTICRPRAMP